MLFAYFVFLIIYGVINSPLSILLLGVDNVGKSEIGHVLATTERVDFSKTKGIRTFNINVKGRAIKLMEIGGAASVRDLWSHYYNEVGNKQLCKIILYSYFLKCGCQQNCAHILHCKYIFLYLCKCFNRSLVFQLKMHVFCVCVCSLLCSPVSE